MALPPRKKNLVIAPEGLDTLQALSKNSALILSIIGRDWIAFLDAYAQQTCAN